jgi:Fic family protein
MSKEAGRFDLAFDLEKIIETHTHYRVAGREKIEVPAFPKPEAISPPWVVRQELGLGDFEKALLKQFSARIKNLEKKPIDELIIQAKEHKKYDTYHSTTLEGYKITPEEVDALLSGDIPEEKKSEGDKYFEEIKNRMAILGYSEAFDFIIGKIQADFGQPKVSEDLVQDTYYHLFRPSADAKLIDYITLVSYRNMIVFIRGSSHVPPPHEKLGDLMKSFVVLIGEIENPVIKAILAHYLFVAIHPYVDGNGRTARLLMNYFLLNSGYPWITIRADQRTPYFSSLEKANVEHDILMFGEFIIEMIEKA